MTIIIPGTDWQTSGGWVPESNGYRGLMEYAEALRGSCVRDCTQFLAWMPSKNNHSCRIAAAEQLRKRIAAHDFAPGEKLNIIAHSHGGNVALAASHLGLSHPIDTLITLNKPTLDSKPYQPQQNIGAFYNISAVRDLMQIFASDAYANWNQDSHAVNHFVDTRASKINPHAALVWDDTFREEWWQWLSPQLFPVA